MTKLTTPLARLLDLNEQIKGWLADIDRNGRNIAETLKVIHEEKLYLTTHRTFKAYFEDVFKRDRNRAYQLIAWAKMPTMVGNERQARELSGYSPEVQVQALEAVGGAENATAASLQAALEEIEVTEVRQAEADATTYRETTEAEDAFGRVQAKVFDLCKVLRRFYPDLAEAVKAAEEVLAILRRAAEVHS